MNDQVEIRLLGRLRIRLGNGSVVPTAELTAGTADALRLFAINADQLVSMKSLAAQLWPDAPGATAAARAHAAVAQILKVLGKNSVTRHPGGLRLQRCWVDVIAHRTLGAELAEASNARDLVRVITAAKQAEALYVDDFHAHDDEASWAVEIRDDLRDQRKLMLVDAAEAAVELGWMRDAIEMSVLAVSLDSCFERAHRSLMRAYAGIGDTDAAARTYDRCRRNLKIGLGSTPSHQTKALHVKLSSAAVTVSTPDLVAVSPQPGLAARVHAAPRMTGDHLRPVLVVGAQEDRAVGNPLTSTLLPTASTAFRVLAEQLEPVEMEICQVMTVLDRPTTAADVMELVGNARRTENRRMEIEARMDHLTTWGVFNAVDDTYVFRDRTSQHLFELWMRPSLRARIAQRLDEQMTAKSVTLDADLA